MEMSQKKSHKFICEKCCYKTDNKSDYNKHILTLKHKNTTKYNKKVANVANVANGTNNDANNIELNDINESNETNDTNEVNEVNEHHQTNELIKAYNKTNLKMIYIYI